MADWHGYPQAEGAHPERPWWRQVRLPLTGDLVWERRALGGGCATVWSPDWPDALEPDEAIAWHDAEVARLLAAYDAAHPLPPPEPRCGQVWVLDELGRVESMVLGVVRGRVAWSVQPARSAWPPPGAVLVAGPGAPWAPMEDPSEAHQRAVWNRYRQGPDRALLEAHGCAGPDDMGAALSSPAVIHEGDGTEEDAPISLGEHVLHMLAAASSEVRRG